MAISQEIRAARAMAAASVGYWMYLDRPLKRKELRATGEQHKAAQMLPLNILQSPLMTTRSLIFPLGQQTHLRAIVRRHSRRKCSASAEELIKESCLIVPECNLKPDEILS